MSSDLIKLIKGRSIFHFRVWFYFLPLKSLSHHIIYITRWILSIGEQKYRRFLYNQIHNNQLIKFDAATRDSRARQSIRTRQARIRPAVKARWKSRKWSIDKVLDILNNFEIPRSKTKITQIVRDTLESFFFLWS